MKRREGIYPDFLISSGGTSFGWNLLEMCVVMINALAGAVAR